MYYSLQVVFDLFCARVGRYISRVAKTDSLVFRVDPALKRQLQRLAEEEKRTVSQICEMLLQEGLEQSKKEGSKFIQRLVAKQKQSSIK
jgi:hypothetical protein